MQINHREHRDRDLQKREQSIGGHHIGGSPELFTNIHKLFIFFCFHSVFFVLSVVYFCFRFKGGAWNFRRGSAS